MHTMTAPPPNIVEILNRKYPGVRYTNLTIHLPPHASKELFNLEAYYWWANNNPHWGDAQAPDSGYKTNSGATAAYFMSRMHYNATTQTHIAVLSIVESDSSVPSDFEKVVLTYDMLNVAVRAENPTAQETSLTIHRYKIFEQTVANSIMRLQTAENYGSMADWLPWFRSKFHVSSDDMGADASVNILGDLHKRLLTLEFEALVAYPRLRRGVGVDPRLRRGVGRRGPELGENSDWIVDMDPRDGEGMRTSRIWDVTNYMATIHDEGASAESRLIAFGHMLQRVSIDNAAGAYHVKSDHGGPYETNSAISTKSDSDSGPLEHEDIDNPRTLARMRSLWETVTEPMRRHFEVDHVLQALEDALTLNT